MKAQTAHNKITFRGDILRFNRVAGWILFSCVILLFPAPSLRALEDVPVVAVPVARKRPPIPTFDAATVQKMVDAIDAPYNFTLLKIGYFTRRGAQPLALEEGYKLVKAAAEKETVGTRKWVLLQSLVGHAAFRVEGLDTAEGFAAYDLLFKTASANAAAVRSNPGLVSAVRAAANDYVASVSGRFNSLGLQQDERTAQTFIAAFLAYKALVGAPTKARLPEPQWAAAIEGANLQEQLVPIIDKALDDPRISKSYSMLTAAALVYARTKPNTALLIFKTAKPFLPKDDLNEVSRFYGLWIDTLAPVGKEDAESLGQAIAVQREMIASYGRGQARLLELLLRAKDAEGAAAELVGLQKADANESEILSAAEILKRRAMNFAAPDTQAKTQAKALLQSYLDGERARNAEAHKAAQELMKQLG